MLKDVIGINITGGCFKSHTNLPIFDSSTGNKIFKGTILYGRNGSGKSTIAKTCKKILGTEYPHITEANFTDKDGNVIDLSDEEKSNIFVFDEEFVDKNIKLQESGLNTIVMIGERADLAEQISKAEKDVELAKIEYEKQKGIVAEYEDPANTKAPAYYINQMKAVLQGDKNWAGRDKEIKGARVNSSVKDDTYKKFLNFSPKVSRDELIVEFNEKLNELQKAQSGDALITENVPKISLKYDDKKIKELLGVKIEKPELSEREKFLLKLAQTGQTDRLSEMSTVFNDKATKQCPYCLQTVDSEYKINLVASIQKVLSKVVENHQEDSRQLIKEEIKIDLSNFEKLEERRMECDNLVNQINKVLQENNEKLLAKIANPYMPIEIELTNIEKLVVNLNAALENLDKERLEYNKKIQATEPIISELNRINSEIAHYDIMKLAKQQDVRQTEYLKEKSELEKKEVDYNSKQSILDDLEAKKESIKIAIDIINNSLKYIFFSEDRLRIEYKDNEYFLFSDGQAVKPSEISMGERNIIALCYFFASILQNREIATGYNNEYLLIIDDPVSSFDMENKVGIMSFLRYQLEEFWLGNLNTRTMVMTHDLAVFYDFAKIFKELSETFKNRFSEYTANCNIFELKHQTLNKFDCKSRQEYTELMKIVFDYAIGNANDYEIVIGNIMRQILEAFATFQYKKGIEAVSTDTTILNVLPEDVYKIYFKNLMYRLVLHGGSHRAEQVKSLNDMNFFSVISVDEKRRTAKDVLCFIYLLNKEHIQAHLKDMDVADFDGNLEQWCKEIKERSVDELASAIKSESEIKEDHGGSL